MSDSIPLVRTSTGRLLPTQYKKILRTLATTNVAMAVKKVIVKWLTGQAVVTSGSAIESALTTANSTVGPNYKIW